MGSPAEGRRRTRGLCSRVFGVDDAPFRPVMGKRGDAGCRQAPRPEGVSQVLIPCWLGAPRDSSLEEERSRRFCLLHILHGVVNQHL